MAPLVPDLIGNELNLVIAILIGLAFGFILEQAGFSSSKKLVGLFYGYDFTVLRVFFTGGLTAMIGVIILGHYGFLDLSLIYVNPTFIWSAITGGLIMGLGFIIGGYCPGTSLCGAAIGKIDAMLFVAGSFMGVFIFAEGYPLFEGLYKSGNWGNPRMFEILGMSQGLFAFLLVFVAVTVFIITTLIEKKVNGKINSEFQPLKLYYGLAALAVAVGISALAFPERQESLKNESENLSLISNENYNIISADELAFRLMDEDKRIQIFDFRSPEEFKKMSLPYSANLTENDIFGKDIHKKLSVKNKVNIFVTNEESDSKKLAYVAMNLGYENINILEGGMNNFVRQIIDFKRPETTERELQATYNFREKASLKIPELIETSKKKSNPEGTKSKRVVGGC